MESEAQALAFAEAAAEQAMAIAEAQSQAAATAEAAALLVEKAENEAARKTAEVLQKARADAVAQEQATREVEAQAAARAAAAEAAAARREEEAASEATARAKAMAEAVERAAEEARTQAEAEAAIKLAAAEAKAAALQQEVAAAGAETAQLRAQAQATVRNEARIAKAAAVAAAKGALAAAKQITEDEAAAARRQAKPAWNADQTLDSARQLTAASRRRAEQAGEQALSVDTQSSEGDQSSTAGSVYGRLYSNPALFVAEAETPPSRRRRRRPRPVASSARRRGPESSQPGKPLWGHRAVTPTRARSNSALRSSTRSSDRTAGRPKSRSRGRSGNTKRLSAETEARLYGRAVSRAREQRLAAELEEAQQLDALQRELSAMSREELRRRALVLGVGFAAMEQAARQNKRSAKQEMIRLILARRVELGQDMMVRIRHCIVAERHVMLRRLSVWVRALSSIKSCSRVCSTCRNTYFWESSGARVHPRKENPYARRRNSSNR
eukprot:COSAG01_NODE_1258_length_11012_cov_18.155136_3_plen_499_part_00